MTIDNIDDIYQSMSAKELWQLNEMAEPIEVIWQDSTPQYDVQNIILDALDIRLIEENPLQVTLGKILAYCHSRQITIDSLLENVLTVPHF